MLQPQCVLSNTETQSDLRSAHSNFLSHRIQEFNNLDKNNVRI